MVRYFLTVDVCVVLVHHDISIVIFFNPVMSLIYHEAEEFKQKCVVSLSARCSQELC